MVLPTVVVLGVLVFYPLVRGIYLSFTDLTEANQRAEICTKSLTGGERRASPTRTRPSSSACDNYVDVLTGQQRRVLAAVRRHPRLDRRLRGCSTTALGLGLAVMLNRSFRGRGLYRVLLILPVGGAGRSSPPSPGGSCSTQRFGLINGVLVHRRPRPGRRGSTTGGPSLFAAIVTNIWLGVPFMMVALLGGLQSIPGDLYEAAEIDGASPWQRFRNITLPGLRPVSSTVILLGTIWTFNMFPIIYLVTGGQPAGQTEILVTGAYRAAFEGIRNYSLAATYGVLILSILMVFAAVYRRAAQARERCSDGPIVPTEVARAGRHRGRRPPATGRRRPARSAASDRLARAPHRAARHADRRLASSRCSRCCGSLLSSFKPANRDPDAREIALVDHPTLDNYRTCCSTRNFPTLVPQLGHRRGVHHGHRHLDVRHRRLRAVPLQLPGQARADVGLPASPRCSRWRS